jgi:hypothetical protein
MISNLQPPTYHFKFSDNFANYLWLFFFFLQQKKNHPSYPIMIAKKNVTTGMELRIAAANVAEVKWSAT